LRRKYFTSPKVFHGEQSPENPFPKFPDKALKPVDYHIAAWNVV